LHSGSKQGGFKQLYARPPTARFVGDNTQQRRA
jgi:hypothetical protein